MHSCDREGWSFSRDCPECAAESDCSTDEAEQPKVKRDLVVQHDTPERRPGIRPSLTTELVRIFNPNDGGFVAIAVADDGALDVVIHKTGCIRVRYM